MKNVIEDREQLYNFYKEYCAKHTNLPKEEVFKEFKSVILLKYDFMPHFFAVELEKRGYDIAREEILF